MQKNLTFDQRTQRIEAWLSDFIELLDAPFAIRQDAIKQGREINDIIEALNGCITSQINAEQFNSILDRIRKSLRASRTQEHGRPLKHLPVQQPNPQHEKTWPRLIAL
jgi:hypothetical protein